MSGAEWGTAAAAWEIGYGAGERHVAYAEAYGSPCMPNEVDVPGYCADHAEDYRDGFRLGVEAALSGDAAG